MSNTATPATALRTLGVASDTYGPTINSGRSPRYVEVLGRALAESLRPSNSETLVVWNTPDDAVLAHAVALQLGVTVRRASEVGGILTLDEPIARGTRVALVATEWDGRWLETLRRLVLGSGGALVAAAAVVGSDVLDSVADRATIALLPSHEAKEFVR
ncbi:hypothetical protein LWP59_18180 [Amycolatopsis acidiphila]|uniref:Uncharacterized protein n=1 Tax=Amycolatopsis acidiphila TaxID=715473 RepID=A0A558ANP4_9PSEU|nr:hypothetical protein [Amycolatopsis acidiphila]TVT25878.1 hypothetical protein FNH06_00060 [Amycolatopsis acidiphila]UIJ63426.1 hypothetical protein LWP59_18180 [Amycolatopsis acidiphila]